MQTERVRYAYLTLLAFWSAFSRVSIGGDFLRLGRIPLPFLGVVPGS
jgi:hypothetical protein